MCAPNLPVLVVDDSPTTCRLLVRLLEMRGYSAHCIENDRDAIAFLQDCRPRLVILDVMMPDVDGFEVLKAIRAHPRCGDVIIAMYSALADPDSRERAMRLGADGYIVKGTGFDEIEAMLQNVPKGTGDGS